LGRASLHALRKGLFVEPRLEPSRSPLGRLASRRKLVSDLVAAQKGDSSGQGRADEQNGQRSEEDDSDSESGQHSSHQEPDPGEREHAAAHRLTIG
jgi:hypothetical protein